jgi:hypothetical protein
VRSVRHRRRRTHTLLASAITILLVAGVGGTSAVGFASLKARADQLQAGLTADLQAGQRELEAGKASLTQANAKHDAGLVPIATGHFVGAKNEFLAASELADSSQLLHGLENTPGVSGFARSRHAAVDGIAGMGVALSEAGQELSGLDGQLLKPSGSGQAGRTLLTVLDQTTKSLTKVRLDLERAQAAAAAVDVQVVPAGQQVTFMKARDTISSALAGLDEFQRLEPVILDVLGGNGIRTYLIEQVDPAELRAGGGFIGSYSLLRADHGLLTLLSSGDAYSLADPRPAPGQPGFIPMPGPYREIIPQVSWSFVDSNMFPDFASNAVAAENFVQPRIGLKLDGVFSIDYYSVAKMLELTGPIALPAFGITIDSSNLIPRLVAGALAADPVHKAIIKAISGTLMERVSALPPDRWPGLLQVLNGLADEHHLQVYFNEPIVEQEVSSIGWSSVLKADASDFMMEIESNYGSKANYFLSRHYSITLTRVGRQLHHEVVIRWTNNSPIGSEDRTYYHVDTRLYIGNKGSAVSDNLGAVKYPNPDPPTGTSMYGGWALVQCCGDQAQAVFEYNTPWIEHDRGVAVIYWQKQPGTTGDRVDVVWNDGTGHAFTVSGDLNQDRRITLTPSGVTLTAGQPAQATLPSLNLG